MPNRTGMLALGALLLAAPAAAQDAPPTTPPAAAPAPQPPKKIRTLVMDLKSNGVDADTVETISGLIAVTLDGDARLEVLSGADVRQMIELESQKQAMGCADDSSCLADVAGALGAELVVFGAAGKLGRLYNLNINLFDSSQSRSVGRVAVQAGSVEELPQQLRPALQQLVRKALAARSPDGVAPTEDVDDTARTDAIDTPPPAAASTGPGALPFVVAGVGAGVFVLGVVGLAGSFLPGLAITNAEGVYNDPARPAADRADALEEAQALHAQWGVLAPVLFVVGGATTLLGLAGVGGGLAWFALAGAE